MLNNSNGITEVPQGEGGGVRGEEGKREGEKKKQKKQKKREAGQEGMMVRSQWNKINMFQTLLKSKSCSVFVCKLNCYPKQ